jgi:hypothetical protein
MNRKTFDKLASIIGLVLSAVLIGAGALLMFGGNFALGQVEEQLVSQKVTFPTADKLASLPEEDRLAMEKYAGQEMTTGDQAYTYANHYIKVHMAGVADGKVYEEVSGEFLAKSAQLKENPTDTALAAEVAKLGGQRQTLFMGSTLVGLLGYAYAFSVIGTVALYASYVAFAAGIGFLILAILGFAHLRKADA